MSVYRMQDKPSLSLARLLAEKGVILLFNFKGLISYKKGFRVIRASLTETRQWFQPAIYVRFYRTTTT